jgi:DNA-binding PadR family transcriptional regulator
VIKRGSIVATGSYGTPDGPKLRHYIAGGVLAGVTRPCHDPAMPRAQRAKRGERSAATREAVAETTTLAEAREAAATVARPPRGPSDPFTGGLRREVLPLLVLHLMKEGPSYGNQLIEWISKATAGVLSVNPNTMYPLLRQLEAKGLIEGKWEHPERRSRRYYSLTRAGRAEYKRLHGAVKPFLDSIAASLEEIRREVYG